MLTPSLKLSVNGPLGCINTGRKRTPNQNVFWYLPSLGVNNTLNFLTSHLKAMWLFAFAFVHCERIQQWSFLSPATKLQQGNVFTPLCDSGGSKGGLCSGGFLSRRGLCQVDRPRCCTVRCGRYASYWNAFLYEEFVRLVSGSDSRNEVSWTVNISFLARGPAPSSRPLIIAHYGRKYTAIISGLLNKVFDWNTESREHSSCALNRSTFRSIFSIELFSTLICFWTW